MGSQKRTNHLFPIWRDDSDIFGLDWEFPFFEQLIHIFHDGGYLIDVEERRLRSSRSSFPTIPRKIMGKLWFEARSTGTRTPWLGYPHGAPVHPSRSFRSEFWESPGEIGSFVRAWQQAFHRTLLEHYLSHVRPPSLYVYIHPLSSCNVQGLKFLKIINSNKISNGLCRIMVCMKQYETKWLEFLSISFRHSLFQTATGTVRETWNEKEEFINIFDLQSYTRGLEFLDKPDCDTDQIF